MAFKEKIKLQKLKGLLKNPPENLSIEVYDESKKSRSTSMKPSKKKNKYTLAQMGRDLAKMGRDLANLNQKVDEGFKQVNVRIDGIDARLDYNNLKRVPENK